MTKEGKMLLKNYISTILIFLCSLTLFAENKLAIIKDPDGYTNVRSGPGKEFNVVDTLYNGDFFYFKFIEDNLEWVELTPWKGSRIEGYVHMSRFQMAENLDLNKQKDLI